MTVTPLRHPSDTPDLPPAAEHENIPITPVSKQPRGRSTIEFPYADLDDAIFVARTILEKGGVALARDQLAAAMGQPVTSGAFVAKLQAARMFGLIEFVLGKSKLTDLGFDAVDQNAARAKSANVRAFLKVPLFERAYSEFRNRQLPPRNEGLEQAFIRFGVLETRKHNARWAFDRSAKQAGYYEHGEDRLVMPVVTWMDRDEAKSTPEFVADEPRAEIAPVETIPRLPADEFLIRGLLAQMPIVGVNWSVAERARWLRAFSVNLGMLYGSPDEADIQITV